MTAKPRITIIGLGGTIAMTETKANSGAIPNLSPETLAAAVPGLDGFVDISALQLCAESSANISLNDCVKLKAAIDQQFAGGTDGIVVTHGTDTLEETAFALSVLTRHTKPIVLTAAMRRPDMPGADGAANLLAACLTAGSKAAHGMGPLVVVNDEIHLGAFVRKSDTSLLSCFNSAPFGPLGRVIENTVRIALKPAAQFPHILAGEKNCIIPVLEAGWELQAETILPFIDAPIHGLVISAAGGGHVSATSLEPLTKLLSRIPVVIASRTGSGATLTQTYGYKGGERDLIQRGFIMGDHLTAGKARVLLQILLSAGNDRNTVDETFKAITHAYG
jgi:L-asparaginase